MVLRGPLSTRMIGVAGVLELLYIKDKKNMETATSESV